MGLFTTSKEEMDEIYFNIDNPPKPKEERSICWCNLNSKQLCIRGFLKSDYGIGFTIQSVCGGFQLSTDKDGREFDFYRKTSTDIGELMDIAEEYVKSKGWHVPKYSKQ